MRRQLLIAAGTGIGAVVLLFVALVNPKSNQVSKVRTEIAAAEKTEQDLRNTLRQLEAARRQAPATQARLAVFDALLPSTPDLPTFIRQVQEAANKEQITLQSIAPSPPSPLQTSGGRGQLAGVQSISVNLTVVAGFFRLQSFLSRLEHLPRVVEVRQLSIAPSVDPDTGLATLSSTITLTMYIVAQGSQPPAGTTVEPPTASPTPTASAPPAGSPSPTTSPGA